MSQTLPNSKYRTLQGVNLLSFLAVIVVNFLANYLPINGLDTGYISDLYPNLFTPAGFTFSIWGLIYAMLGVFAVHQAWGMQREGGQQKAYVRRIGYWFIVSSVCNMAWIFAWHYLRVGLSLLIMVVLFLSLIILYQRLNREAEEGEGGAWDTAVRIAFSLYVGWITIATVANVTIFLVDRGWDRLGLSEVFWMFGVTLVATGIVLSFMLKHRDWVYGAVGLWAFFGILVARLQAETVETAVVVIVVFCMLALVVGIMRTIQGNKRELDRLLPYRAGSLV